VKIGFIKDVPKVIMQHRLTAGKNYLFNAHSAALVKEVHQRRRVHIAAFAFVGNVAMDAALVTAGCEFELHTL
jgi:hypothetical protein